MKQTILILLTTLFFSLSGYGSTYTVDDFERCYAEVEKNTNIKTENVNLYLDSCLEIANDLEEKFYLGKYYIIKGYWSRSNSDSTALVMYDRSLKVFSHYKDSMYYLEAFYLKANAHIFRDEFFRGMACINQTVEIIDDRLEHYLALDETAVYMIQAKCLASLGIVYDRFKDNERALDYFLKSLKMVQKISTFEGEKLKSVVMSNIGLQYTELENYEKAEYYITHSIDLKVNLNLGHQTGFNYRVLGIMANKKGDNILALRYLDIADEKDEKNGLYKEMHKNAFYKAKCNISMGSYKRAVEILQELEEPFKTQFTQNDLADLYQELGEVYSLMDEPRNSTDYLMQALKIRKELGDKEDRRAFDEFIIYFSAEESNFDNRIVLIKNEQERQKMEFQLESNRQKQIWFYSLFTFITLFLLMVILLIAKAYKRNKKINTDLQDSVEEQKVLFQEVHHRVKNNFQIISSLLNLQAVNQEEEKSKKVLNEAKSRIQSMSLVHEMLYRTGSLSKINLKSYCEALVSSILDSFNTGNRVTYDVSATETEFDLDIAISLGLILNEAITNSIKYGFVNKDTGHILISAKELPEGLVQLEIVDNGKGFTDEDLQNSPDGLGLELIEILSEQINGSVVIDSNNGTKITIVFNPTV